jgi:citrate lyase subunit beta/citryl-CoA lyase
VNFKDSEGLRATTRAARHDGFTGRLAIHPDQVPVINEAFTPTDAERAHAQRVVDAFSTSAGAGAISVDGKMFDIPHLRAARRVLGIKEPV